jgi:isopentenyl-diphosphate Delta-isomerase
MMDEDRVILVDARDVAVGTEEKMRAHLDGRLHRAFSVFVFDSDGRLLLQRRAACKYHSAGLWSNTVCSHPRPGEATRSAAHRRLREEMGFDCPLVFAFAFTYSADLGGGLHENEFDHVFTGRFDGMPRPDPAEVAAFRWVHPEVVRAEIETKAPSFTFWFRMVFEDVLRQGYGSGPAPSLPTYPDRTGRCTVIRHF